MKAELPTVVLALVLAFLFAGVLMAYPLNPNEFDATASKSGSEITVDMHATVQSDYIVCAVEMENTDRKVSYFLDDRYTYPVDIEDQEYEMERLSVQLKYTGVSHDTIDADGLKAIIDDTPNAKKHAVVIFSGALPSNVYGYSGGAFTDHGVKDWMTAGGIIYWYSSERFGYYSAPLSTEFTDWETDQPLDDGSAEFGLTYIEDAETGYADERSDISKLLNLTQNVVWGNAPLSAGVTNLGYLNGDGRCSLAFKEIGNGGAMILGGGWTPDMTMAKIITSRVCEWDSLTPDHQSGTFKGDKEITFTGTANAVYVYYGTLAPRYADLFLLG